MNHSELPERFKTWAELYLAIEPLVKLGAVAVKVPIITAVSPTVDASLHPEGTAIDAIEYDVNYIRNRAFDEMMDKIRKLPMFPANTPWG